MFVDLSFPSVYPAVHTNLPLLTLHTPDKSEGLYISYYAQGLRTPENQNPVYEPVLPTLDNTHTMR